MSSYKLKRLEEADVELQIESGNADPEPRICTDNWMTLMNAFYIET